ncbi:MAG: T9SS type A sorting domain-containing protein [Candidatus Marinimicrobia bacterium]|nr:T9SS type A sorting domain-containing protein [Candidatus Neomarinimicrobiota bacterium]
MQKKNLKIKIVFFLIIIFTFSYFYGKKLNINESATDIGTKSVANLNNWVYWQHYDGRSGNVPNESAGGRYTENEIGVIYQDGFVWGGYVQDSDPDLRVGGQTYNIGTQPGWIIENDDSLSSASTNDSTVRIYRYREDIFTVWDEEFKQDVSDLYDISKGQVTQQQIETVKKQYEKDRKEWPVEHGAPYYDRNRNGKWDPEYDEPGILGADQVLYYVVNDLDETRTKNLYGSMPIGIELQITIWNYKYTEGALGQTIYKRYRLINKSGSEIDSMFVGQFADLDIGSYGDDYSGCDSVLQMGYCYNYTPFEPIYPLAPVSVGYTLLQGPVDESQGDTAITNSDFLFDYKNLPMTAFWYKATGMACGDPIPGEYTGTIWLYRILNGFRPCDGEPFIHGAGPNKGQTTKFQVNGDPVTGTGDLDGQGNNFSAGDRRFYISSGPFNMAPGDTQDVIIAIVGGLAEDNIASVSEMRENVKLIRNAFKDRVNYIPPEGPIEPVKRKIPEEINFFLLGNNWPNPFNAETTIKFKLFSKKEVSLVIYNILGEKIKVIYQGEQGIGEYFFTWDGMDKNRKEVSSGVYFAVLSDGLQYQTKKLILIK